MSLEIALATNTAAINALTALLLAKVQINTEPTAKKPASTQPAEDTQAPAVTETAPASPSEPEVELTDEVIRALAMSKRAEGKDSIDLVKSFGGISKCPADRRADLYAALQAL